MADQDIAEERHVAGSAAPSTAYTSTDDEGRATPGDHGEVDKTSPRVAASGACEEVSALVGVAIALGAELPDDMVRLLARVQNDLVDVVTDISAPLDGHDADSSVVRIDEGYVKRLESACDHFGAELPETPSFVLPGGTSPAATLFHARSVVRRAERTVRAVLERERMNPVIGSYLDCLADLLLILARAVNVEHGDSLWQPGLSAGLEGTELWEPFPEPEES